MISGIFTSVAFIMFLGVVYWAYTKHNRARFEEAARLPLEDSVAVYPVAKAVAAASHADQQDLPSCCGGCGGVRK